LHGHTIIEVRLVNGAVVLLWHILILLSEVLLTIPGINFSIFVIIEVLRVVVIAELDSHTVVEIILVNSAMMLLWNILISLSKGLLAFPLVLFSSLVIEIVLGVIFISKLNSHTIVKIGLINSAVVLLWHILILLSKVLLALPSFLLSLLVLVVGLRVVVITGLEGHTLVELSLVQRGILLAELWCFLSSH